MGFRRERTAPLHQRNGWSWARDRCDPSSKRPHEHAVADGESGLLVDPSDHLAVADALVELLRDPARAAAMGEAALQRAQTFTWQAMAARIDAIARAAVARAR